MIALGVDHVQLRRMPLDLPSQDKGCGGIETGVGAAFLGVLCLLGEADVPYVICDIRDIFRLHDVEVGRFLQVALDLRDHGLAGGQVARGEQHQGPIVGDREAVHLAVGADPVGTGIGPRVGTEYESFLESDGEAIGHLGSGYFLVSNARRPEVEYIVVEGRLPSMVSDRCTGYFWMVPVRQAGCSSL